MAGPEDSTSSSHHHGNPDTSDLRLQNSDEDSLLNEKHSNLTADPSTSHIMNVPHTTDITTVLGPTDHLQLDLREAKDRKKNIKNSQTPDSQTVQAACEDVSDVFDVNSHPHLVFSNDNVFISEEDDLEDFASVDSDNEQVNDDDVENGSFFCNANEDYENLNDGGKIPGHHIREGGSPEGIPRSSPWTIPQCSSPLTTVCRHSPHSQVVVRCRVLSTCNDVRKVSSCPAAFSPLWFHVLPSGRRSAQFEDGQCFGRKRLNTVSGTKTTSRPSSGKGDDRDPVSPQDDPTHASFKGRGRSYSDSDVQRLLMREMSKELRRIGDAFYHSRGRRLTAFSEPIIEENHVFDM